MNNQRNSWIVGAVIAVIVIGAIVIWKSNSSYVGTNATTTPTGTNMVLPYGRVTLALGQDGVFQGITIRPVSVAEDSRCSAGVQCIQAGTVRVVVSSTLANGAVRQDTIKLGAPAASVDAFTISLDSVDPVHSVGGNIANKDYRFTFQVHQNGSGTQLQGKG